jgi:hypothetical protein
MRHIPGTISQPWDSRRTRGIIVFRRSLLDADEGASMSLVMSADRMVPIETLGLENMHDSWAPTGITSPPPAWAIILSTSQLLSDEV